MNKSQLDAIIEKTVKDNAVFSNKASLGTLSGAIPDTLVGRTSQTEQIVKYLLGYRQGHVVSLVSIYGRSGTGKSTLVQYVCKNISEIYLCFVNLRKAKTVFGAANLMLAELGKPNLKSAQGMNHAIKTLEESIVEAMDNSGKKLFVLALDEFDVLFYDKRGNPSDFVYKLVEMQSELGQKGYMMCVITISNNVIVDYSLDDRVRSRIGTSEVFFEPYSKKNILEILHQRAKDAFGKKIDESVLEYCAELSHSEHGDARRAVDLLRVAAEIAILENKPIRKIHVDNAIEKLQQDRVEKVLATLSYHSKLACMVLAMKTYGLEEDWHFTSKLYEKYKSIIQEGKKPVSYRRFSELLKELENTGIITSHTKSSGRKGYGSEFKLNVLPDTVGNIIDKKWWQENVVEKKRNSLEKAKGLMGGEIRKPPKSDPMYDAYKMFDDAKKKEKEYW